MLIPDPERHKPGDVFQVNPHYESEGGRPGWVGCLVTAFKVNPSGIVGLAAAPGLQNHVLALLLTWKEIEFVGRAPHWQPPSHIIVCPTCGWVSYNLGDIAHRYCGHCKKFHDEM